MNGRQTRTAFAIGTVTAALIVGCGGGNSPDRPAPNTSASAPAKTATTGDRGSSPEPSAKKDRGDRKPRGKTQSGDGVPRADKAADAGGQPSSYADPQLAQCVEDAGENVKAKDACLPSTSQAQAAEPSARDKALEQCAKAADTPKEKNACLPSEPQAQAAEPSARDKALEQCAKAADTPKEKNACLKN